MPKKHILSFKARENILSLWSVLSTNYNIDLSVEHMSIMLLHEDVIDQVVAIAEWYRFYNRLDSIDDYALLEEVEKRIACFDHNNETELLNYYNYKRRKLISKLQREIDAKLLSILLVLEEEDEEN